MRVGDGVAGSGDGAILLLLLLLLLVLLLGDKVVAGNGDDGALVELGKVVTFSSGFGVVVFVIATVVLFCARTTE